MKWNGEVRPNEQEGERINKRAEEDEGAHDANGKGRA